MLQYITRLRNEYDTVKSRLRKLDIYYQSNYDKLSDEDRDYMEEVLDTGDKYQGALLDYIAHEEQKHGYTE